MESNESTDKTKNELSENVGMAYLRCVDAKIKLAKKDESEITNVPFVLERNQKTSAKFWKCIQTYTKMKTMKGKGRIVLPTANEFARLKKRTLEFTMLNYCETNGQPIKCKTDALEQNKLAGRNSFKLNGIRCSSEVDSLYSDCW